MVWPVSRSARCAVGTPRRSARPKAPSASDQQDSWPGVTRPVPWAMRCGRPARRAGRRPIDRHPPRHRAGDERACGRPQRKRSRAKSAPSSGTSQTSTRWKPFSAQATMKAISAPRSAPAWASTSTSGKAAIGPPGMAMPHEGGDQQPARAASRPPSTSPARRRGMSCFRLPASSSPASSAGSTVRKTPEATPSARRKAAGPCSRQTRLPETRPIRG